MPATPAIYPTPDAHDAKGEVPAAVIRTIPGETVSEEELTSWASARLANFKIPRRIVYATELPRNGTNKAQKDKLMTLFTIHRG